MESNSIAEVVRSIDAGIQEMGGDSLTPVQQQLVFVNAAVVEQKLGKIPEKVVSDTLESYAQSGKIVEAARSNCSFGLGRAA